MARKFADPKFEDTWEVMKQNYSGGFRYDRETGLVHAREETPVDDSTRNRFSGAGSAHRLFERGAPVNTIGLHNIWLGGGRPFMALETDAAKKEAKKIMDSAPAGTVHLFHPDGSLWWAGTQDELNERRLEHLKVLSESQRMNRTYTRGHRNLQDKLEAMQDSNLFTEEEIDAYFQPNVQRKRAGGLLSVGQFKNRHTGEGWTQYNREQSDFLRFVEEDDD